jgi:hypothetical protein
MTSSCDSGMDEFRNLGIWGISVFHIKVDRRRGGLFSEGRTVPTHPIGAAALHSSMDSPIKAPSHENSASFLLRCTGGKAQGA